MRNLKRALSLALASVMLVGMMVVGTSAASFPDVDESKHDIEAIEVLKAVGVMNGDAGTGKLRPDDKVSRNEMAVIMARLILGTYAADSYVGSHPFTDVPSWADRYVAACYSSGIIKGTSATTYGGTNNVTAVQAAAMMLRALGYEDLSLGADRWDIPVAGKANEVNLFEGLAGSSTAQLTRNDIATLSLNALKTTMVTTVLDGMDVTLSDGTKFYATRRYNERNSSANWAEKIDSTTAPGSANYLVQLGEYLYRGDLKLDKVPDDFGRPASEWTYKSKSVIKSADEADLTYTKAVKVEDIYKGLGLSSPVAAKNVKFIIDGEDNSAASQIADNDGADLHNVGINRNTNKDVEVGAKGSTTTVYYTPDALDRSGNGISVTVSVVNYYLAQADEDYNTKDEDIDLTVFDNIIGSATVKNEDVDVSSLKEDDYVVITVNKDNGGKEVKSVSLAETVADVAVTAARNDDYVTAGQKYEYNGIAKADSSGALGQLDFMANGNSPSGYDMEGGSYNLYLDPNGYVLGVEEVEGDANVGDYLILTANGQTTGYNVQLKVMFMDGTEKTITVNDVTVGSNKLNPVPAATDFKKGTFFSFKERSNGEYDLTLVPNAGPNRTYAPLNGSAVNGTSTIGSSTITNEPQAISSVPNRGDSKTLFIADGKTYTGVKNAPKVSTGTTDIYYLLDKDGKLMVVWTGQKGKVSTDSDELIYILDAKADYSRDTANDADVYTYKAIANGEVKDVATNNETVKTGLYEVDEYENDRPTLKSAPITKTGGAYTVWNSVAALDNDGEDYVFVTKGATTSYALASGYAIYSVDDDEGSVNVRPGQLKNLCAREDYKNIILVNEESDGSGDIVAIYIIKAAPMSESEKQDALDNVGTVGGSGPDASKKDSTKLPPNESFVTDKTELDGFKDVWGGISAGDHVLITYDGRTLNDQVTLSIKNTSGTEVYKETTATTPGFGGAQGSFLVSLEGLNHTFGLSGGAAKTGAWVCTGNPCDGTDTATTNAAASGTYTWTVTQNGNTLATGSFKVGP